MGRSQKLSPVAGWLVPGIAIVLFIVLFYNLRSNQWSAPFASWFGPASEHAPLFVSMTFGLVIGFLAQKTRFCAIAAFRDLFIIKNRHYLYGIISMVLAALATNLLLGQVDSRFGLAEQGGTPDFSVYFWPFLGTVMAGLCFSLVQGCAARQLFLVGEGDADAGSFIAGMLAGAAITHNFGFVERPVCAQVTEISSLGIYTIIAGILFCFAVGFTMRIKGRE